MTASRPPGSVSLHTATAVRPLSRGVYYVDLVQSFSNGSGESPISSNITAIFVT